MASDIADLVIDRTIVISFEQGQERLAGLIAGLQDLEELIAKKPPAKGISPAPLSPLLKHGYDDRKVLPR